MSTLHEQIADARKQVKKRAKHFPHLFPEYHTWLAAKRAVTAAKAQERRAKAAWDRAACKESLT